MEKAASTTSLIHASCVAVDKSAVLIIGASGSGKSSLALQLMSFGADLIADDQTEVKKSGPTLHAQCPAAIKGKIEARGVGILNVRSQNSAVIHLVVDLDKSEKERLPELKTTLIQGCSIPVIHRVDGVHFAAAILQFLKGTK